MVAKSLACAALVGFHASQALPNPAASHVRIPHLPSGERLSVCDGLSALDEPQRSGEDDDLLSVGGTVWPAAASLCRWLRDHEMVAGASVLELGGGTGVVGLYAAGLGARQVCLTDGKEGLTRLQAKNILLNTPRLPTGTHVTAQRLVWGAEPPPEGPWDLVIGSDVTYDDEFPRVQAFARTVALLLEQQPVPPRVLLAHDHRQRRVASDGSWDGGWDEDDDYLTSLVEVAAECALVLEQRHWELPTAEERSSGISEISIIEVRRRAQQETPGPAGLAG